MARQRNNADRPPQRQQKIYREDWERWKREAAKPNYAIPAFKILKSAGKVTRQRYLEMMLEMEERFPGRGWHEQMDELEAYYHKHNLPLKDFPLIREIGAEIDALIDNPPF